MLRNSYVADSSNHKVKVVTDLEAKSPSCKSLDIQGLNEPGGLCAAPNKHTPLVSADTNNHVIKKVHVETLEVTEIELEMLSTEELDSSNTSSDFTFKVNPLGDVVQFSIRFNFDPDLTLNSSAPNGWKIQLDEKWSCHQGNKGKIVDSMSPVKFTVNRPSEGAMCSKSQEIVLTFKLYLCSASNSTCTVQTKSVMILVQDSPSPDKSIDFILKIQ